MGHTTERAGEFDNQDVVARAQAGDRAAHDELARRFRSMVYAVALRWVADPDEAEDVSQQVFIDALLKINQLRDSRCVGGWLRQIAVRRSLNRLTRRAVLSEDGADALADVAGPQESPADQMIRREQARKLHDALDELRPADRDVLDAFYLRGEPLKQIAKDLRAPVGTIKRRLHSARARLKNILEPSTAGDDRSTRERPPAGWRVPQRRPIAC